MVFANNVQNSITVIILLLADTNLMDLQKRVLDTLNRNKEIYNLFPEPNNDTSHNSENSKNGDLSDDDHEELENTEFISPNRDTFILEVDDAEDAADVSYSMLWALAPLLDAL